MNQDRVAHATAVPVIGCHGRIMIEITNQDCWTPPPRKKTGWHAKTESANVYRRSTVARSSDGRNEIEPSWCFGNDRPLSCRKRLRSQRPAVFKDALEHGRATSFVRFLTTPVFLFNVANSKLLKLYTRIAIISKFKPITCTGNLADYCEIGRLKT